MKMRRNEEERMRGYPQTDTVVSDPFISVIFADSLLSLECWSVCHCGFFWVVSLSRLETFKLGRGRKSAKPCMSFSYTL